MGNKLASTALFLTLLAVSILNAGAQESSQVSQSEISQATVSAECKMELIEIDRWQLRRLGIDISELPFLGSVKLAKNAESFRSQIVSLEKNGAAKKVTSPTIIISSGETGSINVTTDIHEFELCLAPQITSEEFEADLQLKIIHPDDPHPTANRTRIIEFRCEGKCSQPFAVNVTKLFTVDTENKSVVLLLTIDPRHQSSGNR